MSQKADRTISTALRARVPILAIETPEEGRVLWLMRELAVNPRFPDARKSEDKTRPVFVWSMTQGVKLLASNGDGPSPEDQPDLQQAISALEWFLAKGAGDQAMTPAIFVMLDVHPHLAKAAFVRLLRDTARTLTQRQQNVILVAPHFDLPLDLRHSVTIVHYPLPTVEELIDLVQMKVDAARDQDRFPVEVNGDVSDIARALAALTMAKAEEALRIATVRVGGMKPEMIQHILDMKTDIIGQSGALTYWQKKVGDADIAGLDLLKPYCRRAIRSMEPAAREFGVDRRRGVFIFGMPGCGKSLMAKAIAGDRMPLIRFDVSAVFGELVGQSQGQTRQALDIVDAIGRCVLWIDEIEKALATDTNSATRDDVLGIILTWMEETESDTYVVATANQIEKIRPELLRRFSEIFFVDLPGPNARRECFRIHLAKRKRNPDDYDLDALVEASRNLTGSEIEECIVETIAVAYDEGQRPVTQADLMREVTTKAQTPLMSTMKEEMEHMRTWAIRARAADSEQTIGRGATGTTDADALIEI